jgi:hypothetical protein
LKILILCLKLRYSPEVRMVCLGKEGGKHIGGKIGFCYISLPEKQADFSITAGRQLGNRKFSTWITNCSQAEAKRDIFRLSPERMG